MAADNAAIIKDVLEFIEVHECSFNLIEIHLLDLGSARDIADQPRSTSATIGAGFVSQTAIDEVTCAIAQHHRAARIQRREDQLAGLAGRHLRSRFGIDHFNDAKIGIKMITAWRLVGREGTFGPGLLGLREAIGSQHL